MRLGLLQVTDIENWITGATATVISAATLLTFNEKRKRNKVKRIRQEQEELDRKLSEDMQDGFIRALEKKNEVESVLWRVKRELVSPRVLILKSENGGGIPKATDHAYISILHELPDSNVKRMKPIIQRIPTDSAYNDMLLTMLKNGMVINVTEHMEEGMLKDFYIEDKITCSITAPIITLPDKFLYISIEWRIHLTEESMPKVRNAILTATNRIKNIYQDKEIEENE